MAMHPVVRGVRAILRSALRVFFRRIELRDESRVPATGPVIFVLNHPNGLIDPVFLLCLSPRRVSFIAKSTLFRMPVIGWLCRVFEALPVQRRQDASTGTDNSDTFARARELLGRGGTLAIFPEGISHNEPHLMPLKTGAARIALGTRLPGLQIVPAGLFYTDKAIFRSEALVCYGEPIAVPTAPEGEDEPSAEVVQALTDRIAAGLQAVLLEADEHEALALALRAEEILSASAGVESTLGDRFELRRRIVDGYRRLRREAPARVDALIAKIRGYEADLRVLGLTPAHPDPRQISSGVILQVGARSLGLLALLAPLALPGTLIHYPAYRLIGVLARRLSGGDADIVGTVKVLAALLLFPASWALAGGVALWASGSLAIGGAVLAAAPLSGLVALRFWERAAELGAGARAAWLWIWRRSLLDRLAAERAAIDAAIIELDQLLTAGPTGA
ncbi:MAG: lysophospholipid acyltransferase family protein [Nannocystaceae bacterium]